MNCAATLGVLKWCGYITTIPVVNAIALISILLGRCIPTVAALWAVLQLCTVASASAADIGISVALSSVDDRVSVQVTNTGKDTATAVTLTVTLGEQSYEQPLVSELPPSGSVGASILVDMPRVQGSYPLYALVSYRNGEHELSSPHVGIFNVTREAIMSHECPNLDRVIRSDATYQLRAPADSTTKLFTGPEFLIDQRERGVAMLSVTGAHGLQLRSSVFAVYERHSTRLHETVVCRGTLSVPGKVHAHSIFPSWFVMLVLTLGVALSFVWHRRAQETGSTEERMTLLVRSRAAFVVSAWSLFLLFYRLFPLIPDRLVGVLWAAWGSGNTAASVERWLQPLFFDSGNYAPFFHFLADPLYLYLLLGHYLSLRRSMRTEGALNTEDKLYSLIAVCFAPRKRSQRALPIPGAAIAARALLVKAIFLPLLGSWMIATALILLQLVVQPSASGAWLYDASYHSLLLIDVTVFAASYFIELPRLRNQIRSVEPTLLGWLVCLACYPPLNDLLLIPIDHSLFGYNPDWGMWVRGVVSTVIIGLWGVYVWATLALGWKASNLTHRGIVQGGPYRYCRHPAYSAKLTIWILSGIFLGSMTVPLLAALISLYGLRMWTEERHLAIDADYRAYMKRVPWRVVPGRW